MMSVKSKSGGLYIKVNTIVYRITPQSKEIIYPKFMTTVISDSIGQGTVYGGIHRLWNIYAINIKTCILHFYGGEKLSDFSFLKKVGDKDY